MCARKRWIQRTLDETAGAYLHYSKEVTGLVGVGGGDKRRLLMLA